LTKDIAESVGGRFDFCDDPMQMAKLMIEHIDKKRLALNLKPAMY
jgi:carbon-monoxide dehydrogenase catalytic subunit